MLRNNQIGLSAAGYGGYAETIRRYKYVDLYQSTEMTLDSIVLCIIFAHDSLKCYGEADVAPSGLSLKSATVIATPIDVDNTHY